jgi:hypothetical protein
MKALLNLCVLAQQCRLRLRSYRARAVNSHISPKQGEIWGTLVRAFVNPVLAEASRSRGTCSLLIPTRGLLKFQHLIERLALGHNLSIKQMNIAVRMAGKARIVRNHANGRALTMQVF